MNETKEPPSWYPQRENVDASYINRVFIFGEYFIPKKLTVFDKIIIWFKFKLSHRILLKEAYKVKLTTKNLIYKYEDWIKVRDFHLISESKEST